MDPQPLSKPYWQRRADREKARMVAMGGPAVIEHKTDGIESLSTSPI